MSPSNTNIVERSKEILLQLGTSPILYLMIGLSVLSLAVMIERLWFFTANSVKLESFAQSLEERLGAGDLSGARALTEGSRSVEVSIIAAGLHHAERGVDAAREAMASATAVGRLRLERRLSFLGTLGNNAPFVGLLGTVIGIVQAFDQLQRTGMRGSASADIMGAIAEALVATAIGIAVAIPAVAAFNYFQRRIRTTLGSAEALEHILLSYLEGGGPAAPQASGRTPNPDAPRVRLSLSNLSRANTASLES
jgi:biopolymer transport protein ExbB